MGLLQRRGRGASHSIILEVQYLWLGARKIRVPLYRHYIRKNKRVTFSRAYGEVQERVGKLPSNLQAKGQHVTSPPWVHSRQSQNSPSSFNFPQEREVSLVFIITVSRAVHILDLLCCALLRKSSWSSGLVWSYKSNCHASDSLLYTGLSATQKHC